MNFQKIYDYFFSNNYMTKMPTFGEVLASNVITLLLLLIVLGLYIAGKVLLMKKIIRYLDSDSSARFNSVLYFLLQATCCFW